MTTEHLTGNSIEQHSSPESTEWRRFWRIVLLGTVLPFLTFLGFLEALGWTVGETYTPKAMARAMHEHPDLIWMGLRIQAYARIKLEQMAEIRPNVVVMGTSRVGQIRAEMISPYSFYNLSRVAWPIDTYIGLLRHFPEGYRPKLILFSADFFMFGSKYTEHYKDVGPVYGHSISENLIQVNNVATQLPLHPQFVWRHTDSRGDRALGIFAMVGGNGFRKDGSEQPPISMILTAGREPDPRVRPEWKEYVTGGEKMGEAEMAALKEFVDLARQKGIPLAAIQMPVYGPAWRSLETDPDYGIIADFQKHVAQGYFERLGVPFFDYSSLPPYSEDYHYFNDSVHPDEQLTAAVIVALESDARFHALLPRLDPGELRAKLERDRNSSQHVFLDQ